MRTDTESLWVLALSSKCNAFTSVWFVFVGGCLVWLLLLTLIHWAYPGGPAWGKYKLRRAFNLDYFIMSMMMRNPIPMPSGPRGFPVIGSMNLMDDLAHHRIAAVAEACGAKRLMAFSLGQTRVVVTCNPDVAKEILNSWVFVDRPLKESAYALMFNRAIGFAPYGVYWRTLPESQPLIYSAQSKSKPPTHEGSRLFIRWWQCFALREEEEEEEEEETSQSATYSNEPPSTI